MEKTIIINRPNFLASEVGLRLVSTTAKNLNAQAVTENGRKIIKAGTVYPTNDGSAEGILFQDVDVTDGDVEAPLMVAGHFYNDKVVGSPVNELATAKFEKQGLFGEASKAVTRPY